MAGLPSGPLLPWMAWQTCCLGLAMATSICFEVALVEDPRGVLISRHLRHLGQETHAHNVTGTVCGPQGSRMKCYRPGSAHFHARKCLAA